MSVCNHVYSDISALRVLLSEAGDVLPQAFLRGFAQLAELVRTVSRKATLVPAEGSGRSRAKQEGQ